MNYKNAEDRAALARAQKAALSLARLACYEHVEEPVLLPPALRDGLNVPSRKLTILPSAGEIPHGVSEAVAETRTDLLIVRPGSSRSTGAAFYFTLLRCTEGTVQLHGPLCLWANAERELFLVPDPFGDDPEGQCFALARGVHPVGLPWANFWEAGRGVGLAEALLMTA